MSNRVQPGDGEFRALVIGREGHGKSTVCNALLGKDHFTVGSKTTTCDIAESSSNGVTVKVVDTPDISDNDMKQKEKKEEVNKWKELTAPSPSILLLVIKSDTPYTERDFIAYRQVRRFWGGRGSTKGRLVVVFTFADGQDVNEVGDRMEGDNPKWIGKVFKDSGGRYMVFKGKSSGDFLVEVMADDDDDSDDEGSCKGSPKGSRKGSAGKKRKGSGGSGKGLALGHHKPKGGRGRRRGHSGKRRGHGKQGGLWGLLCCLCRRFCD